MDQSTIGSRGVDAIHLVLVDSHPLVRAGVRTLLETQWGMEVVAEADSVDAALDYCREAHPDVVLVDLDEPVPGAMDDLRRLRRESECAVVTLGHGGDDDALYQSLAAGASGYVAVDVAAPEELARTIERAAAGEEPIGEALADRPFLGRRVLETFRELSLNGASGVHDGAVRLTERQLSILRHASQGLSNRAIAHELGVTEQTIKNQMSHILSKLGVKHRTEAVIHALRRGWISSSDGAQRAHH